MADSRKIIRPVIVTVPAEEGAAAGTYEAHMHHPGRPRIYRRLKDNTLVRVRESDTTRLRAVAKWMRIGVDQRKAAEAEAVQRSLARQRRLSFRIGRWLRNVAGKLRLRGKPG